MGWRASEYKFFLHSHPWDRALRYVLEGSLGVLAGSSVLSIAVTGSIIMHPLNLLSVCFICTDSNSDLQAHFSNELFAHWLLF